MKKFILSIDQGTTGTTALLVDAENYKVIGKVNTEFKQIFPHSGWVEHDLEDIWSSLKISIKKLLNDTQIDIKNIISIGITNQRETTCAYSKDGSPLANAIVWQDRRTASFCENNKDGYKGMQKTTGLPLDPYFSATKMNWFLTNSDKIKTASESEDLCLSTIDTFLLYRLTNSKSFKTEPSNASRTLLMNLEDCSWDKKLLDFFDIKEEFLPKICDSFESFGKTEGLEFLPDGIEINCILGDQQAALFGQGGNTKGDLKCTYGTGAFILLNTGHQIQYSKNNLLTTVAYKHKGETVYALEGATYIAGAAVQWIRDNFDLIDSASEIEGFAKEAQESNMEELLFLPFFTGIGSPYWNSEARGAILGLSRATNKSELMRACLEGIALSVNDSIQALISDAGFEIDKVLVDGGASQNNFLMQLQSNFSKCSIVRPEVTETTAYGVALGALIGSNQISLSDIKSLWKKDKDFQPTGKDYFENKTVLWNATIKKLFC